MTHASVSPLRQRLIDDMTIRHFAPRTQEAYIHAIRRFSAFLGASPDQAGFEDVRRYQLFLIETGASPPPSTTPSRPCASSSRSPCTSLRSCSSAVRARAAQAAGGPQSRRGRPPARGGAHPQVQGGAECRLRGGLRASEVVTLKVSDIDSTRMVIRVEQGKGIAMSLSAAAACAPARLVEGGPAAGLALSRSEPGQPAHPAPAQPRLPCRRPSGRDRQARVAAHPAPQLPPTCSSRMSTSASSRCCSGIPSSTPPPATPAWRPSSSAP